MNESKSMGGLPNELIDDKTFYTLGGASAAVLLVCWAINYIAVDVSWINYKIYRLLGFILSEVFAIAIMYKKKDRDMMKWLFAFLNGILIFVNASGLNIMTSSYIFNPNDSTATRKSSYFQFRQFRSDAYQQAGIFPLPGMISWWPDEKLIERNVQLTEKNNILKSENFKLRSFLTGTASKLLPITSEIDSLGLLKSQITNKEIQIRELEAAMNNNGNELQQQLSGCLRERTVLNDSLKLYIQNYLLCRRSYLNLTDEFNRMQKNNNDCDYQMKVLNGKIDVCNNEKKSLQETVNNLNERISGLTKRISELENAASSSAATLTELFKQICDKNSRMTKTMKGTNIVLSDDQKLKQQAFYTNIDWAAFCKNFNYWYLSKDAVIK